MAKNIGKVLEEEFKASIPREYFYYRLKDSSGAWSGGDKTRFTPSNICDCIVFANDKLYFIEIKNTMGTSLPFGNIKKNQLEGMSKINHEGIKAYFIICYRTKEKCYAVEATKVKEFIEKSKRKSIPVSFCEENGLEIKMQKKKVRYKLDLKELCELPLG